ncbi:capsule biosynthesis protein [Halocynthiibacter styelae]|uniref:Capsule biosynthesis protein n=1 Tax=Halocynthiibacter styelae TaxID=2761955 RepID=A0A8J7LRF6_9RHOB|nr:capsule biosynthesis protein [Paenihalocynthiibacter styelae]MBI1495527.1 capsule biosynthesis protein [Paenihalocynthiibacter styelae]
MNTNPKIKKYRIRRGSSLLSPSQDKAGKAPAATARENPTTVAPPEPAAASPQNEAPKRKGRVFGINVSTQAPKQASETPQAPEEAKTAPSAPVVNQAKAASQGNADPEAGSTAPAPKASSPAKPVKKESAADADNRSEKDKAIDAIRKEGLTGRDLRMARRMAVRNNITASSDYDAIRQLREKGIDPFGRKNMLALSPNANAAGATGNAQLPQKIQPGQASVPGPALAAEANRAKEVLKIQRNIARRRRIKLIFLTLRLAVFVLLPSLIAGIYYANIATPLFSTRTEFLIQQSDNSSGGGLGSLFSGSPLSSSQDSLTVQSYLQSRAAMQRLDAEYDYVAHFSQDDIDFLTRLDADATQEDAFKTYTNNIKIAFDPTEGILKMEVITITPEEGVAYSRALIGYAEEVVDNLSQRLREDQTVVAETSFADTRRNMAEAQQQVIELQQRHNVISSDVEIGLLSQQVSTLQGLLTQEKLRLSELLSNARPNPAQVEPVQNRIKVLEDEIASVRAQMTAVNANGDSLVQISSELAIAQADLATWQGMLQQSLASLEAAKLSASSQTRFLAVAVPPVAPDEPTYPRVFENTMLTFMIMAGVYLMISLTLSVLREQISS